MVVPWANLATPQAVCKALSRKGCAPIGPSQRQMARLVATATTFTIFLAIFPMGAATRPMYSFSENPCAGVYFPTLCALHIGPHHVNYAA